jgi:hypothetical protein
MKSRLAKAHWLPAICGVLAFCGTAACAQGNSTGVLSGGPLAPTVGSEPVNQLRDCKPRIAALVRDLDGVLGSDAETVTLVYEVFHKYFPVEKCNIEDVLAAARGSRFFVGSEETRASYIIAFNSAGVSSRPGFTVQISVDRKTGDLVLPFAKVNGY